MTKTELDLMIELQDVFAPFKGEWWRHGDYFYCHEHNSVDIVISKLPITHPCFSGHKCSWLSLPIDPVNPKRGIAEMVKGLFALDKFAKDRWRANVQDINHTVTQFDGATPTEALLRALKTQKEHI